MKIVWQAKLQQPQITAVQNRKKNEQNKYPILETIKTPIIFHAGDLHKTTIKYMNSVSTEIHVVTFSKLDCNCRIINKLTLFLC